MRRELWGVLLGLLGGLGCIAVDPQTTQQTEQTTEVPPPGCEDPSLSLGTGESAFRPLDNDEMLAIVHGPQGGYHVPLAVRACGVGESGEFHYVGTLQSGEAIVDVRLTQWWIPEDGCCSVALDVYGYIFLYDYELSPPDLAGEALALGVQMVDSTGLALTDEVRIVLGAPAN